jgi:hypothetical protein
LQQGTAEVGDSRITETLLPYRHKETWQYGLLPVT